MRLIRSVGYSEDTDFDTGVQHRIFWVRTGDAEKLLSKGKTEFAVKKFDLKDYPGVILTSEFVDALVNYLCPLEDLPSFWELSPK